MNTSISTSPKTFKSLSTTARLSESLSEREMEVLRMIAQGLSNAEIAEKLVITERTVKAHVSNLLSKLQLNDRTQAAIYAWREGIVEDKKANKLDNNEG